MRGLCPWLACIFTMCHVFATILSTWRVLLLHFSDEPSASQAYPTLRRPQCRRNNWTGFSCSCLCSSSEVFPVPITCSPVYGNDTSCGLLSVYQIVPFRIYIYWCSSVQNSWEALSGNLSRSEQRSLRDRMPPGGDLAVTR